MINDVEFSRNIEIFTKYRRNTKDMIRFPLKSSLFTLKSALFFPIGFLIWLMADLMWDVERNGTKWMNAMEHKMDGAKLFDVV